MIPGYLFIMPNGRAVNYQTGIHKDGLIKGLKNLVDAIHNEGGKSLFN